MKEIKYKGYIITKSLSGWYSVFTSRYGYLRADKMKDLSRTDAITTSGFNSYRMYNC